MKLFTTPIVLSILLALGGYPDSPSEIERKCDTALDCKVFSSCCGSYESCNGRYLSECIERENQSCAGVCCLAICPNAPSLSEHEGSVQCVNNVCTINPQLNEAAHNCYDK